MKKNNKADQEALKEFFEEVEKVNKEKKESGATDQVDDSGFSGQTKRKKIIYKCPQCNRELDNRHDPCPFCKYHGYIPMSEQETKKIRFILFWIILVVAIILFLVL